MKNMMFKCFVGSMLLLFCASDLSAQYKVFKTKGTVEVSKDGKTWNPLQKKDELKNSYLIRMLENSSVEIFDSQNLIYSYSNTKPILVSDIVKQKTTILETLSENPGMRKAIGGTVRSYGNIIVPTRNDVYVAFIDKETLTRYETRDAIPEDVVYYIVLCNGTDDDIMVNVFQKKEDDKFTPFFSRDILLEKNTSIDIVGYPFLKQGNSNTFALNYTKAGQSSTNEFKTQAQKEFDAFTKQAIKEYSDFRDKANAEYAEFMRQAWKEFGAEPPIPVPPSPDPPKPPVFKPDDSKPKVDSVPVKEVIPAVVPVAPPQPVAPIPVAPIPVLPKPQEKLPDLPVFSFSFYNTDCRIRLENKLKIRLQDLSERTIADAWGTLSKADYNPTIADCLQLRTELKLCDWGYYQLLKAVAEKYYGNESRNEAILFQMFILTQSGYKIRISRTTDNRLVPLIPFDYMIFGYPYLQIDGSKFYLLDKDLENTQFYVCNVAFPKEQIFSIQINSFPEFSYSPTAPNRLQSERYSIQLEIVSNKNMIDFFNSYPLSSEWNLYAKASLSRQVKEQLYPVLQNAVSGKSKAEAANILIDFVQTAFAYQVDEERWGYERAFFGDETLHYPVSDCEDRAILFAILVKELLGLDAVLLYYPGHLASAVRFNENVDGDFLMVGNQKYIICDPTYIGATIGMEMPIVKGKPPKVVRI
jgi:hypothetical protein